MLLRSRLIKTDISQVPLPDDSSEDSNTAQFRFMDLPPEVRDNVYEKLLRPHVSRKEHRDIKRIRDYNLEPAILRTCKLVYEEGSRVLYGKNDTFLIKMDDFAYDVFHQGWHLPDLPIAELKDGEAGDMSVLTMEIKQHVTKPSKPQRTTRGRKCKKSPQNPPQKPYIFIGLLSAIPKVCRFLTCSSHVMDLQLNVHLERSVARSPERRQEILSYCLHYCQEARGLGNATIFTEPEYSNEAAQIADLMTIQLDTVAEALSIAREYESRVSKQMKEKRWDEASETLHNALGFFDLLRGEDLPVYLMSSTHGGIIDPCLLEGIMIDMQWKHILCCLEAGKTGDVRHQFREMFPRDSSMHTPAQQDAYQRREADAHCANGKAYEIDGAPNSAIYSYLQALMCAPGHAEADEAIDHLEERVKSSASPEDLMAKLNIEVVLKKFRHQGSGHDPLTKVEAKAVARGFIATVDEIEKFLYNERNFNVSRIQSLALTHSSNRRKAGLSILEPSSAPRLPSDDGYSSEDDYSPRCYYL